ncbi:hypothetical protein ACWCQ1_46985 [Streptomyces sp. NPDC002144]
MNLLLNALPEFLGSLAAAAAISGTARLTRWLRRRRVLPPASHTIQPKPHIDDPMHAPFLTGLATGNGTPTVRCCTLIGSVTADGSQAHSLNIGSADSTVLVIDGRAGTDRSPEGRQLEAAAQHLGPVEDEKLSLVSDDA